MASLTSAVCATVLASQKVLAIAQAASTVWLCLLLVATIAVCGVCILDVDNDGICDCEDECVPAEASAEDNFDYKLIVEEYNVGALGTTYRFYVNALDPTDKISAVFGNDQNPLVINTPDGIYNDPFNTLLECVGHQRCPFRILPRFGIRQLRHHRS